jgi:hypothetical protein
LPQALNDVILTTMAKTPEKRLASASDFLQALECVCNAPDLKSSHRRLMLPGRMAGSVGAIALAAVLVGDSGPSLSTIPPHSATTSRKPSGGMLTLPTGTTITVTIPTLVSTSTHRRGQAFFATLKDPLIVGSETIATTGAVIEGKIEEAEQGGRFKGRAQLVVRLDRLHTDRGIIGIRCNSISRQGGSGFLKRGSPAVLRAGTWLSFHTISTAVITPVSNRRHN